GGTCIPRPVAARRRRVAACDEHAEHHAKRRAHDRIILAPSIRRQLVAGVVVLPSWAMRAIAAVAVVVLSASSARAGDQEKARACFEKGMNLYAVERWDEAIKEFEAGFLEQPIASFLYNIAQSHRQAGRREKAAAYFEKYLELDLAAADRADVLKQI